MMSPKKARKKAGLTRKEVVARALIGSATVQRSEVSGKWPANAAVRRAYQEALGLTASPAAPKRVTA